MADWLMANGATIRATTDPAEHERLLTLHRQREAVYAAVFDEFWQAWTAARAEAPQDAPDEAETASAPVGVIEDPALSAVLASVDAYWSGVWRGRERRPNPDGTIYGEITGESLAAGAARAVAEMQAMAVGNKS